MHRHLFFGFVKSTLTSVINMIRITFTVLIFRIIVKEVILKVLPQIQRREWRQKLNLFISYEGDFCRHFVRFSFARRPRKKCTRASHEMAQFVLKIAFGYFAGTNPINGEGIQSFTIGWFSNRTGTSFDDSAQIKQLAWPMAEREIGNRKSSLVLFARFPVVKWRSRSVAKSA